jgi:signal transduction histidine kinase
LQPSHIYRQPRDIPNLLRTACYLLLLLAALVQFRLVQRAALWNGGAATSGVKRQGSEWQDLGAGLRLFLPIVAAMLASAWITIDATLSEESAGWRDVIAPFAVGLSLLLLVIVRQGITFLEVARLRRENEAAQAKEQALLELDRRKDEFLGVLSHEIRTPLTSLQGYIQLLARRFDAWRPQEDAGAAGTTNLAQTVTFACTILGYCLESLRRLTCPADDLVDDTRIRDGRLTLRCAPCDLGAIVRTAVEEQRALEPDRAIIMELPPTGPVPVVADADRIAQVVTNYLSNALKYSKEDRPVAVHLEVEGEARGDGAEGAASSLACVSVRDDGPGLSLDDQIHVWKRFPRIAGVTVQSGSGVSLGIGLHITVERSSRPTAAASAS